MRGRMVGVPLERLEALATRVGGGKPVSVTALVGGASTRRFYRVGLCDGRSAIAMFVPDATRSDEIVKTAQASNRWPFLEVRDLLQERGVRVPGVLGEACEHGFILVEDLGDDTLAQFLLQKPDARERLYCSAVSDLARAQARLAELPAASIVARRAFDADLLRWEIDHFRQWGLEARGIQPCQGDLALFESIATHVARTIASWPRGFVHRDYQSRNLMVRSNGHGPEELVWIDFQDALLGPRVYDLVALLGDSYQVFERSFIEARLDEYASLMGLDGEGRRAVGREFEIVMVQRKLKDAGRFVFIDRVHHNASFLQYVEPTIEKARSALGRLSDETEFSTLARLLDRLLR